MDDNQRAELARQESARQDAKLQMENVLRTQEQVKLQMENVLRKHERYCPSCSGPTTTGGECVNCMKIDELIRQQQWDTDEVDEAFKNARAEGALIDLQEHGAARAIRKDAGVSGRDVQSMHLAPQSAMKDVPGYESTEALTAFGETADHRSIDAHWKAEFQKRANNGETEITAQGLFDTVSESIRQGNFSDAEKTSLILRLQDELFGDRGLGRNELLSLPYS
jgi:hypothetical protein